MVRPVGVVGDLGRWLPSPARLENWTAVGHGVRTAIVAFGGFALGYWGFDRLQIAVFATFGGLALTGIADFGGTLGGRFVANAAAGLAGVGLASIGTWVSSQSVGAATAVTFAVGLLVVLIGLLGGYFAVASNAVLLYYLVAVGSPTPTTAIPDRVFGVLIGGAFAAVASVALWPDAADPSILPLLATNTRQLGEALLSPNLRADADRKPGGIRAAVDLSGSRPAGPTGTERAALYLVNDLERLDHLLRRAGRTSLSPDERRVMTHAGRRVLWAADTLAGGSAQAVADQSLAGQSPADQGPADQGPADRTPGDGAGGPCGAATPGARFGIADRVQATTDAIVAHADAAVGMASPDPEDRRSGRYVSPVLHGARRLQANLSLRSVHLQDSLRTGSALAIAYLLAREFALQHGFWVELATLTVVRSGAVATTRSVGQAVAGTSIGVVIAFVVINAAGANITAYAVITPIAIALAIYLRAAFSFLAGQAGFTVSVLVLFSLLRPAGWHIGIIRLEDVLVGTAAGLAASVVGWPRGSVAAIGPAAADLIDTSYVYLHMAVQRILAVDSDRIESSQPAASHPAADQPAADRIAATRMAASRREALAAMLRAESAYSQLIAERSDQSATIEWSPLIAAGNRLWYAADIISTAGPGSVSNREMVIRATQRLDAATHRTSEQLRRRKAITIHTEPSDPGATATGPLAADPLAAWIDDLAAQFESPATAGGFATQRAVR